MATDWTVNDGTVTPGKAGKYAWRLPTSSDSEQHQAQIVTPGGLLIKPSQITLIPTKSPKRSGLQHGADDWNYETAPLSSDWYSFGDAT